ncbi:MAG: hypothetical protein AAFV29_23980 [Myxococcota bacterium]
MVNVDRDGAFERLDVRWRHNPVDPLPDRFAHVVAKPDRGVLARQAVARLKERLLASHAEHAELLAPFLDGIQDLVEQAWPNDATRQTARTDEREPSDEDDMELSLAPAAAAASLVAEVEQLEDLLEALKAVRHTR